MIPDALRAKARALHESSLVIDLHADTFMSVRYQGTNIGRRHARPVGWAPFMLHCDLPRWREGGIKAQGFGVVATKLMTRRPREHALETVHLMRRTFAEHKDRVQLVGDPEELAAVAQSGKLAAFIGLEGAHMYEGDIAAVQEFHDLGVRYVTLCHFFANELVSSTIEKQPLVQGITPFAREVIEELNRLGSLVDLAHVHESSFWAALEASTAPVIVSHAACRALRDHHRNVNDDQIRAIARKGGIVGIIFFPWFLGLNPFVGPERVADHIEHVARVAGVEHVSLGSDWDGFVWMPRHMPDAAALPRLTAELLRRFNEEDVRGILGLNFLRTWRRVHELATDPRPILGGSLAPGGVS
jgi:membrane dipeptidase